tara:strand:+ start:8933 stop:9595 length:663 start_codon:yes stop_codon:yes gene_type:complete
MHKNVKNLIDLTTEVKEKINSIGKINYEPKIIAVSKTFSVESINPLIDYGHIHFGENKVQEATQKWLNIKGVNKSIKLHMLGKLQTNKVKQAVAIFDYIHSVDSIKLATKIVNEQTKQNRSLKIFLQVNIGEESQKSGVLLNEVNQLAAECKNINLDVIGLMCLPPISGDVSKYFSLIKDKNDELKFNELSLGMSSDYLDAIEFNTTFIRVGTKIFGKRY